jgi:hypothetical protein
MKSKIENRAAETPPLNGRIAIRIIRIEYLAIFNVQQRFHNQRGNGLKVPIDTMRIWVVIKRMSASVLNSKPRLALFAIDRISPEFRQSEFGAFVSSLRFDTVSVGPEADEVGNIGKPTRRSYGSLADSGTAGLGPCPTEKV